MERIDEEKPLAGTVHLEEDAIAGVLPPRAGLFLLDEAIEMNSGLVDEITIAKETKATNRKQ